MKIENIGTIDTEHRQLMRAIVFNTPQEEILEEFELTEAQFKKIKASPLFQSMLTQMEEAVFAEMVKQRAPYLQEGEKSVEVLRELRDDPNTAPSVRARCAMVLMQMNYGKPGTKLEVTGEGVVPLIIVQSDDTIEEVLEEAREAGVGEEIEFEGEED